jgi:hypothetical protein
MYVKAGHLALLFAGDPGDWYVHDTQQLLIGAVTDRAFDFPIALMAPFFSMTMRNTLIPNRPLALASGG